MSEGQVTVTQEATPTPVELITPVTAAIPVNEELKEYNNMSPDIQKQVDGIAEQIIMNDTLSIIGFGSSAQQEVTTVSEKMLEGVKNKDTGPVGEALNSTVLLIRGLDPKALNESHGFFGKLMGKVTPVAKFVQQYESVKSQIATLTDALDKHKVTLVRDVTSLDVLYNSSLNYFQQLELYIVAGQKKLEKLDTVEIPALQAKASSTNAMVDAQALRDLMSARDDLERRTHDLKLTRQVIMQSLPSIRLVQENDKMLISKIQSQVINTIPLWKNQLAQAITIQNTAKAAQTVKAVNDLNNELLQANAANLKQANAAVRTEMERGIFDIEAIKKANDTVIATLEETIKITEDGKTKRAAAERELVTCESKLKETLRKAAKAA